MINSGNNYPPLQFSMQHFHVTDFDETFTVWFVLKIFSNQLDKSS